MRSSPPILGSNREEISISLPIPLPIVIPTSTPTLPSIELPNPLSKDIVIEDSILPKNTLLDT